MKVHPSLTALPSFNPLIIGSQFLIPKTVSILVSAAKFQSPNNRVTISDLQRWISDFDHCLVGFNPLIIGSQFLMYQEDGDTVVEIDYWFQSPNNRVTISDPAVDFRF